MYELLEPICLVTYFADECAEEFAALGHRTYWDGYFASRAAPLGRVPAQVVHAAFYSFADGEAARHIPSAWETIPPEASLAARERGSVASLRRILGEEGFISVIVVVDSQTGKVVSGPEIHARGFAEDDTTFDEIKDPIIAALGRADAPDPEEYPIGSHGPAGADQFLLNEGRKWQPIG